MTAKRKTTTKRAPAWTKTVNPDAFASLDAARGTEEVMIHVYWSALGDARDKREGGHGHRMQRDKATANLGLDCSRSRSPLRWPRSSVCAYAGVVGDNRTSMD